MSFNPGSYKSSDGLSIWDSSGIGLMQIMWTLTFVKSCSVQDKIMLSVSWILFCSINCYTADGLKNNLKFSKL